MSPALCKMFLFPIIFLKLEVGMKSFVMSKILLILDNFLGGGMFVFDYREAQIAWPSVVFLC